MHTHTQKERGEQNPKASSMHKASAEDKTRCGEPATKNNKMKPK